MTARSLLTIDDLGADGVRRLLDLADHMAEVNRRPNPKVPALRGKTVCSVFFEDSTRTRLSFETAAETSQGESWLRIVGEPVGDDFSVTLIDITQRKRNEDKMLADALRDPLTGVLNRRGFESEGKKLVAENDTAAVLYLDLNHFKNINDRFGHRAGDEAGGFEVTYLPNHVAATDFPDTAAALADYAAVILSDIGANTLLLHPETFARSVPRPDRVAAIRDYVEAGGGLLVAWTLWPRSYASPMVAGEGEAGLRGGPTGDLYIFIEVKEHALFQRDGTNLYCRVPVSMASAALGGDIEVPTIDGGRGRVKVPAGSQSGRQMRLRGKGMPALRGGSHGDMFIELAVETPVNLTSKQRDLLREFEKLSEENNPESSGFFRKVKTFWDDMTG